MRAKDVNPVRLDHRDKRVVPRLAERQPEEPELAAILDIEPNEAIVTVDVFEPHIDFRILPVQRRHLGTRKLESLAKRYFALPEFLQLFFRLTFGRFPKAVQNRAHTRPERKGTEPALEENVEVLFHG